MSNFDLLDTVLPTEGRYCVMGIGRYADQNFVDTREEAEELIQEFVTNNIDAYFGCAKFGPENNRTHANAMYFKALWMDIDCGPTKGVPDEKGKIAGYLDQQIGLSEFSKFCKTVGLPKPILVNSGNGIHAYWLLDKTISRREWEPLSQRLRELCEENALIVDSSVFEASRILRPLNSFNFKDKTNPKPVEVWNTETPVFSYEQIKELLGAPEPKDEAPDFLPRSVSPMMEAVLGNKIKKFQTIMMRSGNGDGCNQLLHCYQNQNDIEEPLWFSALSIAAHCADGEWAAHKLSDQYEGYDADEVNRKLANLRKSGGPHHCATFKKLNPTGCDGCPHEGKIKSPIVLGIEIAEAETDEVEFQNDDGEVEVTHIPEYPFPYFRGKNGGVYKKPEDDEEEAVLVYEHDLYVVKRMKHTEQGEVALMRLHLPQDGVKEFSVPATAIVVKEKLREVLAHYGVVPTTKQMGFLSNYLTAFIKNLQFKKKAEVMRTQFGWIDNDSKFILGDREVTKDGVYYSPPSGTTREISANVAPKGDFARWKEVFNLYDLPGLEPHAFAALTGFGSPLLKFTGMKGAIINLIHRESGTGKSTTLYVCNSIVGHPQELASIWKDTPNSKMFRLGVMNNLANTIDEITNIPALEFSDLIYGISQGRGKDRMKSQSNEMRINNTKWQGITLTSSNASFYEKLGAAKNSPDGENMRLLEYKIEPSTVIGVSEGKQMFDHQLMQNYGHAAEPYLQWLVNNLEEAVDLVRKVQARIDSELRVTAKERFWSATAACNIAGGLIAKNLGLIDYDMGRVYRWTIKMLNEMRADVKPPEANPSSILGEYINAHMANTLVVNGNIDARTSLMSMPLLEPKGELLIRYEPDTKDLFISAKSFKDYCVRAQINYKDTLRSLTDGSVYKETVNKRMAKGMKVLSPAVRVLRFNADKFDFLQVENLVGTQDEDRDSVVSD